MIAQFIFGIHVYNANIVCYGVAGMASAYIIHVSMWLCGWLRCVMCVRYRCVHTLAN